MKTTEFLDAVRTKHGLTSDYQLARFLGVRQGTISRYRTARGMMDEAMCIKIATALELEPGDVMIAIAIEREKRLEVKTAWQRVAKRLAGTAAAVLVGGYITLSAAPNPALAGSEIHICDKRRRGVQGLRERAALAFAALVRALALTLALAAPAAAGAAWTTGDTWREAGYQVALAVDCAQTRYGAAHPDQFAETNRFLPEHPSKGQINNICVGVGIGHYLISRWIPSADARTFWQGLTIFLELYAVDSNRMVGARVEF